MEDVPGSVQPVQLKPGEHGILTVDLPQSWNAFDALYIKGIDPYNNEIFTWSFPVKGPEVMELPTDNGMHGEIKVDDTGLSIFVRLNGLSFEFDKKTGSLVDAIRGNTEMALKNGPRFITDQKIAFDGINQYSDESGNYVLEFSYQGDISKFRNIQYSIKWTVRTDGLLDLDVSGHYMQGITFDYPEEEIKSVKRLADGPFRVWRNRMKGTRLGVWENEYNNTITGEPSTGYNYPEFKGFYSSLYWTRLNNWDGSDMTVYCHTPYTFLRLFTPETSKNVRTGWGTDAMEYYDGDISFLNAILPIGTMFKKVEDLGPQSQIKTVYGWDSEPVRISLTFDFR